MGKEILTFDHIAISNRYWLDIDKILISKYFIGNKDAQKIKPLYITLLKMKRYTKKFDKIKYLSFSIKD